MGCYANHKAGKMAFCITFTKNDKSSLMDELPSNINIKSAYEKVFASFIFKKIKPKYKNESYITYLLFS